MSTTKTTQRSARSILLDLLENVIAAQFEAEAAS